MNDLNRAIDDVVDLHRNRFALLRSDARPKIATVSIAIPEEIAIAAGAIPFRITGESGTSTTDAGARLNNNYCSYVLSCLAEGLDGLYDFADAVVFTDACDMRKRMWEAWTRDVRGVTPYFLELPNDASDLSKEYFARELRKWIDWLGNRYGRVVTDDDLRAAIALCNTTRALLQRLESQVKNGRPLITGDRWIGIVKAAKSGLKEAFHERLAALLDVVERTAPAPSRKRPRVMICGSYFDQPEIIETIEAAGADLVCGDLSNGVKYFEGQIATGGDPVEAIAAHYLDKNTSARRLNTDVRLEHLLDLVRDYRVDAVIYYVLKFCDTNLHDYPYIKRRLREEKIPVLFIESERNATNIAGTRTRIQTFLEPRI